MMNLNQCRIKELEQENAELKAHVERLRGALIRLKKMITVQLKTE